jgi:hypothetical protein
MSDDFSPIRPRPVPLSHGAEAPPESGGRGVSALTWGLALVLAAGLLGAVFFLVPAWLESRPAPRPDVARTPASDAAGARRDSDGPVAAEADEALPPYQQLQREQAREQAQEQLARFVELQIELEDAMQVGAWGAEAYDAAKALAAAGDEEFVRERFAASVESYRQAADALASLIERGRQTLEEALDRGAAALAERRQGDAEAALDLATTIAPEDPRVAAARARLELLPELTELMRQGRNQELAGDWEAALESYRRAEQLDPATAGLDEALARVESGRRQTRVQNLLSRAFGELDAGRFDGARAAFREVLDLDPGNAVAEGGLEQVAKQADVARINALKTRAEAAAAEGRWADAADLYGRVLDLDATIQFAQAGRAEAEAQARTQAALARILERPDRLSSDKLYREARQILERAEQLTPRGDALARQIADVRETLEVYANPVPVVLRSDNRTEITLSTVGALGSFEEKRLELRPGAYTVVGSRDGCRDVREQIVVRPNMGPVDIRCAETL